MTEFSQAGDSVILEDQGFQFGTHLGKVLGDAGNAVVSQNKSFEAQKLGQFVKRSDEVVGEIDARELVVGGCQVLQVGNLVSAQIEVKLVERVEVLRPALDEVCT